MPGDPTPSDRLALALWWLIESVADELEMPPERAADEVAMLCGLAKEMMGDAGTYESRPDLHGFREL